MDFKLSEIYHILNAESNSDIPDIKINYISTDSRLPYPPKETIFLALKGPQHNGHRFIKDAYQAGIRVFISEENPKQAWEDAYFITVNDSLQALQSIAAENRTKAQTTLVGITGSNGKTIVKDWLFQLLHTRKNLYKSPKSYNSQVGVALSLLKIEPQHQFGIIEAGISQKGEMERLQEIIKPELGVITNIGPAHDSGFQSREEKLEEKLKLFNDCTCIYFREEHTQISEKLSQMYPDRFLISWSTENKASDFYFQKVEEHKDFSCFKTFIKQEEKGLLKIPFTAATLLEDALHAVVVALDLGVSFSEIEKEVQRLQPLTMRLELIKGIRNNQVLDDSYSNDMSSLELALQFQSQQKINLNRTLILSDLLESSLSDSELIAKLSELLKIHQIKRFIGIGPVLLGLNFQPKNIESHYFATTEEFIASLELHQLKNEFILIKGARSFGFEKIVERLEDQHHETIFQINLKALENNLNYYRNLLKPHTKIMTMVKAFSYGSGGTEIAHFLAHHQVDYLAVAYPDEGFALRAEGITSPIMVMNARNGFHAMIEENLEPEIYSISQLNNLIREARGRSVAIHVKIDTGMRRLGFTEANLPEVLKLLQQHKNIKVQSIFSHLPNADMPERDSGTEKQLNYFKTLAEEIELKLGYTCIKHILNTAGTERFAHFQLDMVRLGIGLYGPGITDTANKNLLAVGTLKTRISQIKDIKTGEEVGYTGKGKATQDSKIATIAIGYADGFDRRFGNGVGEVIIRGKKCSVIGNVCMDMTMIDIGDLEAREGDEVIVYSDENNVSALAKKIGTIPYELLTSISHRVKRIFYYE